MPKRYAELLPQELDACVSSSPIAIVPIGALEWHGPHLPLGLDGMVAERFSESLAERLDAVLLPCFWTPITTLPHKASLQVHTEVLRGIMRDTLGGLARVGFRVVCLVTGHYAQGHELELYAAAQAAMHAHPSLRVLAATPLELLGRDELLDHAGRWETAQFLTMRPDLVHLEHLPDSLDPKEVSVLGHDPRLATEAEGKEVLAEALAAWSSFARFLLDEGGSDRLAAFYSSRQAAYEAYKQQFYKGSWEDAILAWWEGRNA